MFESPILEHQRENEENDRNNEIIEKDYDAYLKIADILKSSLGSSKELKSEYPKIYKSLEGDDSEDNENIIELRKKDKKLDDILARFYLETVYNSGVLDSAISEYVHKVGLHKMSRTMGDISGNSDSERRSSHNNLIATLSSVIRACDSAGIDTEWKNVLGFTSEGSVHRTEVQRWAENVVFKLSGNNPE